MSDFVIKLSQSGYDVKTCSDSQLLFSSEFPLLKVHQQGKAVITNGANRQKIATHSAGYFAPFIAFVVSNGSESYHIGFEYYNIGITENELWWLGDASLTGVNITLYYYVFQHNLESDFLSPSYVAGKSDNLNLSQNYGFKLSLPGRDVKSNDLRDFVIHSSVNNLLIHSINYGTKANTAINPWAYEFSLSVSHLLGYPPLCYFYEKLNNEFIGDFYWHRPASSETIFTIGDNTINYKFITDNASTQYAYIIFKDSIV